MAVGKIIGIVVVVIILVSVLGFIFWGISTNNRMVDEEANIDESWADVAVVYQLKLNKIPQLLNLTEMYMDWEASTISNITELRSRWMEAYEAGDVAGQVNASNELDRQMAPIMVTIENYPNLDSITVVSNMMYEISEAETMIAVAKLRYNADVRTFNAHINKFPASWIANRGGFEEREYYQPDVDP